MNSLCNNDFVSVNNVLKNMMIWKKQSKIQRRQQLIKDFNFFIKQFYYIVWHAESKNSKFSKIDKGKLMLLIKCAMVKNSKLIKEQETSELLKTYSSKVSLLDEILLKDKQWIKCWTFLYLQEKTYTSNAFKTVQVYLKHLQTI